MEKDLLNAILFSLAIFLVGAAAGSGFYYLTQPDELLEVVEEVVEELEPTPIDVYGQTCWLDANPEFKYMANSLNVQVLLTCSVDVMMVYIPAGAE